MDTAGRREPESLPRRARSSTHQWCALANPVSARRSRRTNPDRFSRSPAQPTRHLASCCRTPFPPPQERDSHLATINDALIRELSMYSPPFKPEYLQTDSSGAPSKRARWGCLIVMPWLLTRHANHQAGQKFEIEQHGQRLSSGPNG